MGTEINGDSVAEFGTELEGVFSARNVVELNRNVLGIAIVGAKALQETAFWQEWKLQLGKASTVNSKKEMPQEALFTQIHQVWEWHKSDIVKSIQEV